jgi:1-acyl-sn-glycerol-3-phosphate acyltransferase
VKLSTLIFNVWLGGVFLLLIVFFLLCLFPMVFLPVSWRYSNRLYYAGTSWMTRIFLWAAGIELVVQGREQLELCIKNPAVIVLNHQSAFDVMIAEVLLGGLPRLYFANDYSNRLVLGTLLRRMHVMVQRASVRSSHQSLDQAIALARTHGNRIVIFPEGTRHSDGEIHKFYRGFTVLAEQLDCPVVPIFLHGLHKIMPKGSRLIKWSKNQVIVRVGAPLVFHPAQESREEFLEKVHNWFTLECNKVKS